MARGGFAHAKARSPSSSERSTASPSSPSTPKLNSAFTILDQSMSAAEDILAHWDNGAVKACSSASLHRLILTVEKLHQARKLIVEGSPTSISCLLQSQTLMDKATKRLQLEFHRILAARRDVPSSDILGHIDNEVGAAADLRSIARCMINCGHGKQSIEVYRLVRHSHVKEALYKLGFDHSPPAQLKKLPWHALEDRILSWVGAAKTAVRNIFAGEHTLCRQTFSSSSVEEALYGEIIGEDAAEFFAFPELVVSKTRLSPEKIFRLLDMYETILELLPEIESVFSHESTWNVRAQVQASLSKLGEAVRLLLEELEFAIKKDNTKAIIPGGGLHPLARYVANFVALLADYRDSLVDIFAEDPAEERSPLSGVSLRLGSLIFYLVCKLDTKAELYGDPALGYLFLANNLQYLVRKIQQGKLTDIFGEDWVRTHATRARRYAASFERLVWKEVIETISGDPTVVSELEAGIAADRMRRFNEAFDATCKKQAGWVVADGTMEQEMKRSVSWSLTSAYRPLYNKCRGEGISGGAIRFAPEDLVNYISDLFYDGHSSSVYSRHDPSCEALFGRSH
ncbi:exocyst complex component EXO70H1-like [Wolffia australiana]